MTIIYHKFKLLIHAGHIQTQVYKLCLTVYAVSSIDIQLICRCDFKNLRISLYVWIVCYFLLITCISSTVLHVIIRWFVTLTLCSFSVTVGAALLVAHQHHHGNSQTSDKEYPNCKFGSAKWRQKILRQMRHGILTTLSIKTAAFRPRHSSGR
jgi:hypothetical protein